MDKNKWNVFGYKLGYTFGIVVALCAAAAIVGVTIKFLFWLF